MIYPAAGMLVMAIEAAKQTAKNNQIVKGYNLRDVLFQRALTIPRHSDGIETHFYLRQTRDISDDSSTWSEFRLCAYENGQWNEHCRGFVQTEYELNLTEIDGGKEDFQEFQLHRELHDSVAALCRESIEPVDLYAALNSNGFGFGPAFQRLKKVSYASNDQAIAAVGLYEWPNDQFPQPHVVHPISLDGILHVTIATARCIHHRIPTAVPTFLRSMWIANSGLSFPDNSTVVATVTPHVANNRNSEFDISVLNASLDRVLARFEGLRLTVVADSTDSTSISAHKQQACYRLEVQPDLDLLNHCQTLDYCALARDQTPEPVEYFRDLTFLLFVFLSETLEALGDDEPIVPHLQKYLSWGRLQVQRYHSGELPHGQPGWEQLRHDSCYVNALRATIEKISNQGRVFVTTGCNLLKIMRGIIDPLEFFFKSDLLRDLYQEINNNRACFSEFDRYLSVLAHKHPDMKMLEIGAGTGGTTSSVLRTLTSEESGTQRISRYSTFTYTDISQSFFEQAKENLKHYPRISFQPLDIEKDPTEQGFEAQSYDFIIAANVLHATKDINRTMHHVRKLMKRGAKLMMYEPTQPDILRTGFVAGLLPGWWLGTESFRPWGPALTSALWQKVLTSNDFSGLDLEFPDYVDPVCQEGSILLSTAMSPMPLSDAHGRMTIVVNSLSKLQAATSQRLKVILETEFSLHCEIMTILEAVSAPEIGSTTFLFLIEMDRPVLLEMSEQVYYLLQKLLVSSKGGLWVTAGGGAVSKDPAYSVIYGLSRSLRNENPDRVFSVVALVEEENGFKKEQILLIREVLRVNHLRPVSSDYESEYVEIEGRLNIPRAVQCSQLGQDLYRKSLNQQLAMRSIESSPPLRLTIGTPGLLDTLHFIEDNDVKLPLAQDDIEIQVHVAGVNFKDCLIALGRVPGTRFGNECVGIVTRTGIGSHTLMPGDRVVMSAAETFKTFARGKAYHVCKIPDELSFLEAASIPVQFGTAWQAIHEIARIQKNETILIHAAAGGTGQAAIQIAQYLGAKVFATVSSDAKRQILMKEYDIPENHIFYSRDTSFAKGVKRMTKGRGVDVVINSLAGSCLVASWQCIASYGRFVEIGKKDILSNSSLPMYPFRKNASFTAFDGSVWLWDQPAQAHKALQTILDLFTEKKLHTARPLHVNSISSIEKAFRSMQDGRQAGKTVLEMKLESQVMVSCIVIYLQNDR